MIFKITPKAARLERKLALLTAELEAEKLKTKVVEAERDNLAAVVARDRARISAEGAAYASQRAIAEGKQNESSANESIL